MEQNDAIVKWFNRKYPNPNGKIDWENEFFHFYEVVKQSVEQSGHASRSVLTSAIACAKYMVEKRNSIVP